MKYGSMLDDAYSYTINGVIRNKDNWIKLVIATFILGLPLLGYIGRVLRGEKPAPEINDRETFSLGDGIKMAIICIIYFLPIIFINFIVLTTSGEDMFVDHTIAAWDSVAGGSLGWISLIFDIIIMLLLPIGIIQFSRTRSMMDAFNFSAILGNIQKIGWFSYILALVVGGLAIGIPLFILFFVFNLFAAILIAIIGFRFSPIIPFFTFAIWLIIIPLISVFMARYLILTVESTDNA